MNRDLLFYYTWFGFCDDLLGGVSQRLSEERPLRSVREYTCFHAWFHSNMHCHSESLPPSMVYMVARLQPHEMALICFTIVLQPGKPSTLPSVRITVDTSKIQSVGRVKLTCTFQSPRRSLIPEAGWPMTMLISERCVVGLRVRTMRPGTSAVWAALLFITVSCTSNTNDVSSRSFDQTMVGFGMLQSMLAPTYRRRNPSTAVPRHELHPLAATTAAHCTNCKESNEAQLASRRLWNPLHSFKF